MPRVVTIVSESIRILVEAVYNVKWVVSERLIYEGVGTYWALRGFLLGVEAVYKVNRYGLY